MAVAAPPIRDATRVLARFAARIVVTLAFGVALGVGLAACSSGAADVVDPSVTTSTAAAPVTTAVDPVTTTIDPVTTAAAPVQGTVVRPDGFERTTAVVHPADGGEPCRVCVWVADRDDLRARGLMGVTDLGPAVGMVFTYDEPRTTAFTMRNTPMPLSIAFFDRDGRYLDAFDMEPCTDEPCPRYETPSGFTVAIEVPLGALDHLAIGPDARLVVTADACE